MSNQRKAERPLKFVEQRLAQPAFAEDQVRQLQDTVRQMGRRIVDMEEKKRVLKQDKAAIPTAQLVPIAKFFYQKTDHIVSFSN